jgi:hypothetical protein
MIKELYDWLTKSAALLLALVTVFLVIAACAGFILTWSTGFRSIFKAEAPDPSQLVSTIHLKHGILEKDGAGAAGSSPSQSKLPSSSGSEISTRP